MEKDAKWTLFSGVLFSLIGIYLLVQGIGPEVYSYITIVIVWSGAVFFLVRGVRDLREAKKTRSSVDSEDVQ